MGEPPGGGGGLPVRPGVEIAVIVGEFSRFRETVQIHIWKSMYFV